MHAFSNSYFKWCYVEFICRVECLLKRFGQVFFKQNLTKENLDFVQLENLRFSDGKGNFDELI